MNALTLDQIRSAVNGKLIGSAPADLLIDQVCTDTRALKAGCLFVALSGERFDAHAFLNDAANAGIAAALVERRPADFVCDIPLIQVPNSRAALGDLARFVRTQFTGKVVAVAGSNGKTSTKYLIGSVLEAALRGSVSPKSFNNDVGVPLAILPADANDDYLVLEIGTNHPGEISALTRIAAPDIGVITNCGAEHLEFLGDLNGVRKENACLIESMSPDSTLIVNGDDDELLRAVSVYPGNLITFGFETSCDLFATEVQAQPDGTRFLLNDQMPMFVPMLGRHAASNALAAIAVARQMGIEIASIAEALAEAKAPDMRLELKQLPGEVLLLNDAYNANPNSMRAALQTAADLPVAGRRIAVLGDMRELGATAERYHREIGQAAAESELTRLACVGEHAKLIAEAARSAGMSADLIQHFPDAHAAAKVIPGWLGRGDLLLLKASRTVQLEIVAEAVTRFANTFGFSSAN